MFNSATAISGSSARFSLPEITDLSGEIYLTFWIYRTQYQSEKDDLIKIQMNRNSAGWEDIGEPIYRYNNNNSNTNVWVPYVYRVTETSSKMKSKENRSYSVQFAFTGISDNGEDIYIDDVKIYATAGSSSIDPINSLPKSTNLYQNYPNPFNPITTINYDVHKLSNVTIQIYNYMGQLVKTLVKNQNIEAGRYSLKWDGTDNSNSTVSSGLYFYNMKTDKGFGKVMKAVMVK